MGESQIGTAGQLCHLLAASKRMLIHLLLRQLPSWQRLTKAERKRVYQECLHPVLTTAGLSAAKRVAAFGGLLIWVWYGHFRPAASMATSVLVMSLAVFLRDFVELVWGIWHKNDLDGLISHFSDKVSRPQLYYHDYEKRR